MAKDNLPKWANTVTPFSKMLALTMLIVLPILGFFYGMYYQRQIEVPNSPDTGTIIIVKPTPPVSSTVSPQVSQTISQPADTPPNGRITCTTNADCPADYFCAQPGPIIYNGKQHRSCWKKGSIMPL